MTIVTLKQFNPRTTITCYDTGQYDYHVPFCVESGIFRVRRQKRRKRGSLDFESDLHDDLESDLVNEESELEDLDEIEDSSFTDS